MLPDENQSSELSQKTKICMSVYIGGVVVVDNVCLECKSQIDQVLATVSLQYPDVDTIEHKGAILLLVAPVLALGVRHIRSQLSSYFNNTSVE